MHNNIELYILEENKPFLLTNYIFGTGRKIYPDKRDKILFEKIGNEKTVKTAGNPNCDTNYLHEISTTALDAGTNAVLLTKISSTDLKPSEFCGNEFCGMWAKELKDVLIQPIKITQGLEYLEPYKRPDNI